jgi:hypothetical protein
VIDADRLDDERARMRMPSRLQRPDAPGLGPMAAAFRDLAGVVAQWRTATWAEVGSCASCIAFNAGCCCPFPTSAEKSADESASCGSAKGRAGVR